MLAMSSVSGILITLLVVESASSDTYFLLLACTCSDSTVSMGSGLGEGWRAGEVDWDTELLELECVAVLHGVNFTSHDCSEAAALAARTLL